MKHTSAFAGKTALITGGSSGIGLSLARALAEAGAHVVIASRSRRKLDAALASLSGLDVQARPLDVRDRAGFRALVGDVITARGAIDYMFNNAGIAVLGELRDHTDRDWDDLLDVNLRGVVNGVCAVYPHMIARGSGHIVNIASVGGFLPTPFATGYTASKFGVVGLSEALRIEAERYGVRVSVVCPAVVDTAMAQESTCRNLDRARFLSAAPSPRYDAGRCAHAILRGVAANQRMITPHAAFMLAIVHRFFPWLTRLQMRRMARIGAHLRDDEQAHTEPPAAQAAQ